MPVDIGEAKVPALKAIGQPLVIEAEQVHDGRLKIMDVYFIFGYSETQFIRRSVVEAFFDAPTRHPHRESVGIVVAAFATL